MHFEFYNPDNIIIRFDNEDEKAAVLGSYYEAVTRRAKSRVDIIGQPETIQTLQNMSINQTLRANNAYLTKLIDRLKAYHETTADELANIASVVRPVERAHDQILRRQALGQVAGQLVNQISTELDIANLRSELAQLDTGEIDLA